VNYNKSCMQKIAKTVMDLEDPDLASKAHEIMQEALKAAEKFQQVEEAGSRS
jgi:hypothetical protein